MPDTLEPFDGDVEPAAAPAMEAYSGDLEPYEGEIETPEAPGWGETLVHGVSSGLKEIGRSARQAKQLASGEAIEEAPPEPDPRFSELDKPLSLRDAANPKKVVYHATKGLIGAAPVMGGAIAGGIASAAAVGGPENPASIIAAPLGAISGAALVGAAQALAPAYGEALKANGGDHDAAFATAMKKASLEGGITAATFAAFELVGPAGVALKGVLRGMSPEAAATSAGFAKTAEGTFVPPARSALKTGALQAGVLQPGVAATGQVAKNVQEGRPLGENVEGAALEGAVGTAVPMVAHAGVEQGKRILRRSGDTPATPPEAPPPPDNGGTPPPAEPYEGDGVSGTFDHEAGAIRVAPSPRTEADGSLPPEAASPSTPPPAGSRVDSFPDGTKGEEPAQADTAPVPPTPSQESAAKAARPTPKDRTIAKAKGLGIDTDGRSLKDIRDDIAEREAIAGEPSTPEEPPPAEPEDGYFPDNAPDPQALTELRLGDIARLKADDGVQGHISDIRINSRGDAVAHLVNTDGDPIGTYPLSSLEAADAHLETPIAQQAAKPANQQAAKPASQQASKPPDVSPRGVTADTLRSGDKVTTDSGDEFTVLRNDPISRTSPERVVEVRWDNGKETVHKASELEAVIAPQPYTDASTGERKMGAAATIERQVSKPAEQQVSKPATQQVSKPASGSSVTVTLPDSRTPIQATVIGYQGEGKGERVQLETADGTRNPLLSAAKFHEGIETPQEKSEAISTTPPTPADLRTKIDALHARLNALRDDPAAKKEHAAVLDQLGAARNEWARMVNEEAAQGYDPNAPEWAERTRRLHDMADRMERIGETRDAARYREMAKAPPKINASVGKPVEMLDGLERMVAHMEKNRPGAWKDREPSTYDPIESLHETRVNDDPAFVAGSKAIDPDLMRRATDAWNAREMELAARGYGRKGESIRPGDPVPYAVQDLSRQQAEIEAGYHRYSRFLGANIKGYKRKTADPARVEAERQKLIKAIEAPIGALTEDLSKYNPLGLATMLKTERIPARADQLRAELKRRGIEENPLRLREQRRELVEWLIKHKGDHPDYAEFEAKADALDRQLGEMDAQWRSYKEKNERTPRERITDAITVAEEHRAKAKSVKSSAAKKRNLEEASRLYNQITAAQEHYGIKPAEAPPPEPTAEQHLFHRLKQKIAVFASGMSRSGDLQAASHAWGGMDTRGVGVEIGELSPAGAEHLASAIVDKKIRAFVDSGAYSVFTEAMRKAKGDPDILDQIFAGKVPEGFRELDFDQVLARYDDLLTRISRKNEDQSDRDEPADAEEAYRQYADDRLGRGAEEDLPKPLLVMPDVVGSQAASLELVKRFADRIRAHSEWDFAEPIIPIQKGELTLAEAYRKIVETLGTDRFIVGIPGNKKAVTPEEMTVFLREAKPRGLHILGAASESRLEPLLKAIAESGHEPAHLSSDANLLRSKLYGAEMPEGRPKAVVKTLATLARPEYEREIYGFTPEEKERVSQAIVSIGREPFERDEIIRRSGLPPETVDRVLAWNADRAKAENAAARTSDEHLAEQAGSADPLAADVAKKEIARRKRIADASDKVEKTDKVPEDVVPDEQPAPEPPREPAPWISTDPAERQAARQDFQAKVEAINETMPPGYEIQYRPEYHSAELSYPPLPSGSRTLGHRVAGRRLDPAQLERWKVEAEERVAKGFDRRGQPEENIAPVTTTEPKSPEVMATEEARGTADVQEAPAGEFDGASAEHAAAVEAAEPAPGIPGGDGRGSAEPGAGDREADAGAGSRPDAGTGHPGSSGEEIPGDEGRGGDRPSGTDLVAGPENREGDPAGRVRGLNVRLTDEDAIGAGGPRAKAKQNIEAIEVLRRIQAEDREATVEEQRTLAKYTGWGALANIFREPRNRHEADNDEWRDLRPRLKELLSPEDYAEARASTINAHYTSPAMIRGMWSAVQRLGFKGMGRVLEPSIGVGHFFGFAPDAVARMAKLSGVELDPVTAGIAKLLYPRADIRHNAFEKEVYPENFYDVAVGNVPFADIKVNDKVYNRVGATLHNYFFLKSIKLLKPGGVLAFVTSRYTLDALSPKIREELYKSADLVGAIRLPGGHKGAFAGNAGTAVTTDVLFLRRRKDGEEPGDRNWILTKEIQTPDGPTVINGYFVDHPDMALGEHRLARGMYRDAEYRLEPRQDEDLGEAFAKAAGNLPEGAFNPERNAGPSERAGAPEPRFAPGEIKNGAFYSRDGQLYRRSATGMEEASGVGKQNTDKVARMVEMRDAAKDLLQAEIDDKPAAQIAAKRKALNKSYDAFVAKYGAINKEVRTVTKRVLKSGLNQILVRRPNHESFKDDPDAGLVAALEVYDSGSDTADKAAILQKRLIEPKQEPTSAASPVDALPLTLAHAGTVDMAHIAKLSKVTEAEAAAALKGLVYRDTDGSYKTADEYLSGNVRQKLALARAAAKADPGYRDNVEALERVQPRDLVPSPDPVVSEIDARLGQSWIDPHHIRQFLIDTLDLDASHARNVDIRYIPETALWTVKVNPATNKVAAATSKWGTERLSAVEILHNLLNSKDMKVSDWDEEGKKYVVNAEATLAAKAKAAELQKEFASWIWRDEERARTLAEKYNWVYNNTVPRVFDPPPMQFPGMTAVIRKGDVVVPFNLTSHQTASIWRMVQTGNTLLAHEVGAGKTFTMIGGAMEQKRLGLVKKPLFAVPNHMLEQFSREFLQMYPTAKILIATKEQISPAARKAFVAKAATGDWDAVIMTHSGFNRIPLSDARYAAFMREEIENIENAARMARDAANDTSKEGRSRDPTVKQLEKAKKKFAEKLDKLLKKEAKDDGVTFEQMGVDHVLIDEAHLFKNLYFTTRMAQVKGLAQRPSQRAEDLFTKIRYLEEINPNRAATFATATPVSNTLAEMYTMQRYLQLKELKARGIDAFDAWARNHGETTTDVQMGANGKYQPVTRFARYVNAPEMMGMFGQVADWRTAEMLKLPRPDIAGGAVTPVKVEANDYQRAYMADLVRRAEAIKGKPPEPGGDNMLKIIGEAMKLALDPRILDETAPGHGGKIDALVERAMGFYRAHPDPKDPARVQVIFCDLGVPGRKRKTAAELDRAVEADDDDHPPDVVHEDDEEEGDAGDQSVNEAAEGSIDTGFDVYNEVARQLVKQGVKRDEIAFIHDAKNDLQKAEIFSKTRSGQIRFLLGSTEKMGVGTNVQDRVIALHHLDAPWRPADVTQRDGRGLRQGNRNKEIHLLRYVTANTMDAFRWVTLDAKAKFIAQLASAAKGKRRIDDIDSPLPEAATMAAEASGDPRILRFATLAKELEGLQHEYSAHQRGVQDARYKLGDQERRLRDVEARFERIRKNAAVLQETRGDKFAGTVEGVRHTDRVTFGKHLADVLYSNSQPGREIGEIGGMRLSVYRKDDGSRGFRLDGPGGDHPTLITERPDSDPGYRGLSARVENTLDNIRSGAAKDGWMAREVAQVRKNLAALQDADKPFPKSDEYLAKSQEHEALRKELENEGKDKPEAPAVEMPERVRREPTEIRDDMAPHIQEMLRKRNDLRAWVNGLSDPDYGSIPPRYLNRLTDSLEPEKLREDIENSVAQGRLKREGSSEGDRGLTREQVQEILARTQAPDQPSHSLPGAARTPSLGPDAVQPRQEAIDAVLRAWRHLGLPTENLVLAERMIGSGQAMRNSGARTEAIGDVSGTAIGKLAAISLAAPDIEGTGFHEGFHVLENAGIFTPAEMRVMEAETGRLREMLARGGNDLDVEALTPKEVRAHVFEAYAVARAEGRDVLLPNGAIARAFARAFEFLRRVGNALRRHGFRTSEDVFRSAYEGRRGEGVSAATPGERQAFKDGMKSETGEPNYKLNPVDAIKDILRKPALPHVSDLGTLFRIMGTPEAIGARYPQFGRLFARAKDRLQTREVQLKKLIATAAPYLKADAKAKSAANKALEIGNAKGLDIIKENLRSITNDIGGPNDPRGLNLSQRGETVTLDDKAWEAAKAYRRTLDDALEMFKQAAYDDFGIDRATGPQTADAALRIAQAFSQGLLDRGMRVQEVHPGHFAVYDANGRQQGRMTFPTPDAAVHAYTAERQDTMERFAYKLKQMEAMEGTGYHPQSRFGDYGIGVWETDAAGVRKVVALHTYATQSIFGKGIGRILSKGEIDREHERLKGIYADPRYDVSKPFQLFGNDGGLRRFGVNLGALDQLASYIGADGGIYEPFRDAFLKRLQDEGFKQHFILRDKIAGYDGDLERALRSYMMGLSGFVARRKWDPHITAAYDAIGKLSPKDAKQRTPELLDYAKSYLSYLDSGKSEAEAFRMLTYVWTLGGNVSSFARDLFQLPNITLPYLTMFAHPGRVGAELAKASVDVAKMVRLGRFDLDAAPPDVRAALKAADPTGVLAAQASPEQMAAQSGHSEWMRSQKLLVRQAIQKVTGLYSSAQRINRLATFIATYRLGQDAGFQARVRQTLGRDGVYAADFPLGFDTAKFAAYVTDATHFDMTKVNRPQVQRGALGAVTTQFKGYHFNNIALLARMATQYGPEGKRAFALSMGLYVAAAGALGLPFAQNLIDLIEAASKEFFGETINLETEWYKFFGDVGMTTAVSEALLHGLSRSMTSTDMGRRLGNGDPLPTDRSTGINWKQLAGPGVSVFGDAAGNSIHALAQGRPEKAAAALLPPPLKGIAQGAALAHEGYRSQQRGNVMVPASRITTGDVIAQSLGFRPAVAARAADAERARTDLENQVKERNTRTRQQLMSAMIDLQSAATDAQKDAVNGRITGIIEFVQAHNKAHADPAEQIHLPSPQAMRQMVAQTIVGTQSRKAAVQSRSGIAALRDLYPQ